MQLLVFAAVAVVAASATSMPGPTALLAQPCTPREVKSDYCNSCICQEDGRGYRCTTYECPIPAGFEEKPVAKRDDSGSCTPGQTKRVACYTCHCGGNPPNWVCPAVGCI